ncbi:Gfo/Idh/MocA family oxidoreductase [Oceanospirillaceae bacterium]|nr:Gfo/Idh/MocA family oxidoreductase [Oceanospirillaceae bacterium]MDC1350585.1 Gfo/Idh/MocA family oxidoreductase [Oceanospirillaceae bacterium]
MTENQINRNLSWDGVCIIGLGDHAMNKLVPGLESAGLQIIGVVSRNPALAILDVQIFLTVADAISSLPETTLFVIATPPNVHYAQVKAVIEAGRDVFVEKPAFLSLKESVELSRLAGERSVVLVEMLMYLENNSVQQILSELKCASGSVTNIECQFLIPSVPLRTFRTEASLGNSLLSDIACYPLSLLAIAGYDLSNLVLVADNLRVKQNPIFCIKGKSQKTNIHIRVGCDGQYRNNVRLVFDDDREISCEPFFYGRKGHRKLIRATNAGMITEQILEANGYERMFLRKRQEWLAIQETRWDALGLVSDSLDRLGRQAGML